MTSIYALETVPTNQGPMTATQIVDELTYSSYAHNRNLGMTAEQLGKLFPRSGAAMEARYLGERDGH